MEYDFLKIFLLEAARKGDFKSYSHHLNAAIDVKLGLLDWQLQQDSTKRKVCRKTDAAGTVS